MMVQITFLPKHGILVPPQQPLALGWTMTAMTTESMTTTGFYCFFQCLQRIQVYFFIQNDDMNYFLANTWESFVATQHPLALGETMMAMTAK